MSCIKLAQVRLCLCSIFGITRIIDLEAKRSNNILIAVANKCVCGCSFLAVVLSICMHYLEMLIYRNMSHARTHTNAVVIAFWSYTYHPRSNVSVFFHCAHQPSFALLQSWPSVPPEV